MTIDETFLELSEEEREALWGCYHENNSATAGSVAFYLSDEGQTRASCLHARGVIFQLARKGALVPVRRVCARMYNASGTRVVSVRAVPVWAMPAPWFAELRRRDVEGDAPPWVDDPDNDYQ